jgi:tetratricopeptide (TPR) repeat protein
MRLLQILAAAPRRRPRLVLLALAIGLIAVGIGAAFLWSQYHLHAAERALKRCALNEAQHHLDLSLRVRPGSTSLHLLAAQTARRRDAYEEAEQHLTICLQSQGVTTPIELERLLLGAQQGELDAIEGPLRTLAASDTPEAVLVLEALAKGYLNRFAYAKALDCLNILLKRQPRHPQALLMRARLQDTLARKGDKDGQEAAVRDYRKAVELNPSFEARLGLAGALFRIGQTWEATYEYEKLRALESTNPVVLIGLARCRYSLHEVEDARQLLDEILDRDLSPSEGTVSARKAALLERGRLALHAGDWAVAEKSLREAASLAPRYDCEPLRALHRCLDSAHKTEEARQVLDEIGEREKEVLEVERLTLRSNRVPHDAALLYEIGLRWIRLGREQDGVATLYSVLEEEPRHRPTHEALADYFERTGQPNRALAHRRAFGDGGEEPSSR